MRSIYHLTSLLSMILAVACVMEEPSAEKPAETTVPEGYHLVTLRAGREDTSTTKTTYGEDKIFSWSSGDQISVLFNNGSVNKFFTFTTTGTGASASFTGLVEDGYDYEGSASTDTKWALFPASENHVYTSDTDIRFFIPEGDDGSVCNIPMIAQSVGTEYLFHHMCGAVKFIFRGLAANQEVKLSFDSRNDNRKTSGLFNIQRLSYGVSEAIIRGNYHEDGAEPTRYAAARANSSGVAVIYLPLPMSEYPSENNASSQYWASFYFDLWNADKSVNLCEIHPASGSSFKLHKGRITVIPPRQLGEEPMGGITIDGDFSDWDVHTERYMGSTLGEVKATADRQYLYIYQKIINSNYTFTDSYANYQFVYVDTDNDINSGCTSSSAYKKGAEKQWKFFNFFDHASAPYYYKPDESTPFQEWSEEWKNTDLTGFDASSMYRAVKGANYLETEYCIPLSSFGITPDPSSAKDIAIGLYCHYKDGSNNTVYPETKRLTVTIPGPSVPAAPADYPLSFTEATEDYMNPERGLYNQTSFFFDGSSVPDLTISASHPEPLELVLFYLTGFKDKDLTATETNAIGTVFANLRAAGKKAIVRFAYSSAHGEGDKPWDADLAQMRSHIAQIKPVLAANEDIIYVVQAGFIGTYGEWYYTGNGLTSDDFYLSSNGQNYNKYSERAQIITDLLDAVPSSRQLALRTPFYKRAYLTEVYGSTLLDYTDITDLAMDNANKRLSFFNDAFLADNSDDTGTFYIPLDWDMWQGQSAYLIAGGETAYQSTEPNPEKSGISVALARIGAEHYSYLNKNPENKIMKSWTDGGNLNQVKKALGYRLVATAGQISYSSTASGSRVDYSISIRNKGSVRVIYPRPAKLVYIHLGAPKVVVEDLGDVRSLLPGAAATTFSGYFNLPGNAEAGDKIAVWLPDNDEGLSTTASYSIRLGNSDIRWESGYNVIYTF